MNKRNNNKNSGMSLLSFRKGSAVVLVLVTLAIISIFASLVLSVTLAGFQTKVWTLRTDEDFFYLEEELDAFYMTIGTSVNTILIDEYKYLTSFFSTLEPAVIQQMFFTNSVRSIKEYYDTLALGVASKVLVNSSEEKVGTVTYAVGGYEGSADDGVIRFKDVKVEFVHNRPMKRDYYNSITTDIVVEIPHISTSETINYDGTLGYVVIAGDNITLKNDTLLNGNIYTEKDLSVVGSTSNVNIFSNYLTVGQTLNVTDGSLTVSGSSHQGSVWVKDISTANTSLLVKPSLSISGNIYVADDLEINGYKSNVSLSGKYYGYGDGAGYNDGTNSSAILVNGQGSSLDMQNVDEVIISGRAYFPLVTTGSVSSQFYQMFESLSMTINQNLYQVNEKYIKNGKDSSGWVQLKGLGVDDKIMFGEIKDASGKSLEDYLTEGYELVTTGVEIEQVLPDTNPDTDALYTDEEKQLIFVQEYLGETGAGAVKLGAYTKGMNNYCYLYWNFDSIIEVVEQQFDAWYATGSIQVPLQINDVYSKFDSRPAFEIAGNIIDVSELTVDALGEDGTLLTVGDIYSSTNYDADKYAFKFIHFTNAAIAQVGGIVYNGTGLNESQFVQDCLIGGGTTSDCIVPYLEYAGDDVLGRKVYNVRFGWKLATGNDMASEFITTCLNKGFIDKFIASFLDGGAITLNSNTAQVFANSDLFEYRITDDGYQAVPYDTDTALVQVAAATKNIKNCYSWLLNRLTPDEYVPSEVTASTYNESVKLWEYYFGMGVLNAVSSLKYLDDENVLLVNGDLTVEEDGRIVVNNAVIGTTWNCSEGIVICNGKVTVNKNVDFHGLIIAKGGFEATDGKFTYDEKIVKAAIEAMAKNETWKKVFTNVIYSISTTIETGNTSFKISDVISYENWTKNKVDY